MRRASEVLRPVYGEALSSWFGRLIDAEYIDREVMNQLFAAQYSREGSDLDALYKNCDFMELLDPRLRSIIPGRFELPPHCLSFFSSDVYCPRCIKSDIAEGRSPAWRAKWRTQGECVCEFHQNPVLLMRLESTRFNYASKGWLAFGEYINSPASRLSIDFSLSTPASRSAITQNKILLHLIGRVQRWIRCMVAKGQVAELSLPACRNLLYIWLWQNVDRAGASGFARQFFRPMRGDVITPSPRKGLGVDKLFDKAEVPHLAVAHLLLGVAYGVISEKEASLIREITFSPAWIFPVNRAEVVSCGLNALGREALEMVRGEVQHALGEKSYQLISWALQR